MIVVSCPGQGSQKPGFLAEWLQDDAAKQWLTEVSDQIGIDLVKHGTESDEETIRSTEIAQPLIVAAGILAINALRDEIATLPAEQQEAINASLRFAGHSVGEITAAYGAGVFDAATAVKFVAKRAKAMQQCANANPSGMSAVLGGDPDSVTAHLESLGLAPANFNGAGQIVAAGSHDNLAALNDNPPEKARVIPLKVAGAFHTAIMAPARDELAATAAEFAVADPHHPIYTNEDGSLVTSGAEFQAKLISQVASPVRWDRCMDAFAEDGITALVELAPAGALVGLAKRSLKTTPAKRLDNPSGTASTVEFIAEHLTPKQEA